MTKIAIIAGEPSGDLLASMLIKDLNKVSPVSIQFIGIGGERMMASGLKSSYAMHNLSVGGFGWDLIKAIPKILHIRNQIIQKILKFKPDVFIGVDAPDFNFYVEKILHKHGIKTVHYISPTIWAWRYKRIYKIKKYTDLMLCIFPMEKAIYHKEGVNAKFVGNQIANNIEFEINTNEYKDKLGLTGTIFTILLGSRVLEVNKFTRLFIEACNLIIKEIPNATFLFPLLDDRTYKVFEQQSKSMQINFKYKVLVGDTLSAIKASDMVLAKSGTVTLEVALCKKPLIISYKVSKFTEWIVRKFAVGKYVGQPNILLDEEVAPELLQEDANPIKLAQEFVKLYNDKERKSHVIEKFKKLHRDLRQEDNYVAAKAILELINNERSVKQ